MAGGSVEEEMGVLTPREQVVVVQGGTACLLSKLAGVKERLAARAQAYHRET